jgi:hypothetical protein
MTRQTEERFQLLDAHHRQVGEVVVERRGENLLFGEFIADRAFSDLADLFRAFEEAVNLQALRKVDELDAAIAALGLYLRSPDGSQEIAIRDVQIWSDGGITCRPLGAAVPRMDGSRGCTPSQPVRLED